MKIKIDGTDRATYIPATSVEISNVITKQVDTARFTVRSGQSLGLEELQEVIICSNDESTRYFAGFIEKIRDYQHGVNLDYDVECVDYTYLLEHPEELVNSEYEDQADSAILADFMPDAAPDIEASTHVESVRTLDLVRFPRQTPREALEILANLTGADWYVDYGPAGADKAYLHYFTEESNAAPFDLSDAPDFSDSYPYENLRRETWAPTANLVEVVGGDYLSTDQTLYLAGNGEATKILTPYKLRKTTGGAVSVWRNDGSDAVPSWTALTLGTGYLDSLADYDALLYFGEKFLEFASAPPDLKKAVKVEARYEVPLRLRVRDYDSYAEYGRWLSTRITDEQITSKSVGRRRAKKLLAEEAIAQPRFSLSTRESGLRAGQYVRLVNSLRSIDADYLIQRVVTRFLGGDKALYEVELGLYNPDLVDLIVALKRETPVWNEEEVLDELLEVPVSVPITVEVTVTMSTTEDYYWDGDADDDGDTDAAYWDFASWA